MLFQSISAKASGEEANLFGYQIKSVLSGSMEPEMKTGSIIFVKLTDADQLFYENDVITFKTKDNMTVTHRIKQVNNEGESFVTKGDANDGLDIEPVQREDILGSYNGISIPYLGYVMMFLRSSKAQALIFILPGLAIMGYAFFKMRQAIRGNKNKKNKKESSMD